MHFATPDMYDKGIKMCHTLYISTGKHQYKRPSV